MCAIEQARVAEEVQLADRPEGGRGRSLGDPQIPRDLWREADGRDAVESGLVGDALPGDRVRRRLNVHIPGIGATEVGVVYREPAEQRRRAQVDPAPLARA